MRAFSRLLDQLAYEPRRNGKLKLMQDYFRATPDPDRGYALAALTAALDLAHAKPSLVRGLVEERVDPVLFRLSYDYVGDLSETVALIWPQTTGGGGKPQTLSALVELLGKTGKSALPGMLAQILDNLDETERWALLKLITGGLRVGVSARLAKSAVAAMGGRDVRDVEEVWHGLKPPYEALFAWLEGSGTRPDTRDPAPFHTVMLSHAIEDDRFGKLDAAAYAAEWKWDGIRVQAVAGMDEAGMRVAKLYSRTGDEISQAFPDLLETLDFDGALDGELLIRTDGLVQPFSSLQQRLNRKSVSAKMMRALPAHIRAYDLIIDRGADLRNLPFMERRAMLEAFVAQLGTARIDISPLVAFKSWDELAAARANPAGHGAGADAAAVEGCMIKRRDSLYVPGRPKGLWYKWKRDPYNVDAVLMYAQRGHGKRSSFYSDYTFGVWRGRAGDEELVPVGKAYFGFTDEELRDIDRFVRQNTVSRFGPVREVTHSPDAGLVLEIAFEGLNRSPRHKSGLAMRFPRIARLRWDKSPRDADRIEALEALLPVSAAV